MIHSINRKFEIELDYIQIIEVNDLDSKEKTSYHEIFLSVIGYLNRI